MGDVLLYHVLPAKVLSTDLSEGLQAGTLDSNGNVVTAHTTDGVKINTANVVAADVLAANGVVHVLDEVIFPQSIVDLALGNPDLTTLVAALTAADLVDTLAGDGTFTVFAPTNAAFAALPDGTLDSLLQPENKQNLTDLLLYHVLGSVVKSSDLSDGLKADTLQGQPVTASVTVMSSIASLRTTTAYKINGANVVSADNVATNGVIHNVDAVLSIPVDGGNGGSRAGVGLFSALVAELFIVARM